MKVSDAPPRGWYPDPQGGLRLRWWDGTDWSDRFRSRPSTYTGHPPPEAELHYNAYQPGELRRPQNEQLISQVRQAARAEAERAADLFSARARAAVREVQPLVTQYTNRVLNWIKFFLAVVFLLLAAWLVFQVIAQVSIFEWLGDRIDNLTDNSSPAGRPVA